MTPFRSSSAALFIKSELNMYKQPSPSPLQFYVACIKFLIEQLNSIFHKGIPKWKLSSSSSNNIRTQNAIRTTRSRCEYAFRLRICACEKLICITTLVSLFAHTRLSVVWCWKIFFIIAHKISKMFLSLSARLCTTTTMMMMLAVRRARMRKKRKTCYEN